MHKYELMMIVDPTVSDDDRTALLTEVQHEVTQDGSRILTTDLWGVKNLAYKIRASQTGYYVLFTIESTGRNIPQISKHFNLKKAIWRYMFIRLEDETEA